MNLDQFREQAAAWERGRICCWVCEKREAVHHEIWYLLSADDEMMVSLCDPCWRASCRGDFRGVDDLDAAFISGINTQQALRIAAMTDVQRERMSQKYTRGRLDPPT